MAVGDVHSSARGSGARFNDGKPPLELIPLELVAHSFRHAERKTPLHIPVFEALHSVGLFQVGGGGEHLAHAVRALDFDGEAWTECARVFDYGRAKYAAWNWAKGMPWSVPIGCIGRHALAMLAKGETTDPESGLTHRGHLMCNLVMLQSYLSTYPEGDDRPLDLFRPARGRR